MPDDPNRRVSPSENEVPEDKGSEAIEHRSRAEDNEPKVGSVESRRSLASRPGGRDRVPNFLPAHTKINTDKPEDERERKA